MKREADPASLFLTTSQPRCLEEIPLIPLKFLHGADYWRTLLDVSSGIDIYGHNGVSMGDIDNDDFDDLYICQPAGLSNRLYRNRGTARSRDITEASGVGVLEDTACALFADIDNDGRQDLISCLPKRPAAVSEQGRRQVRTEARRISVCQPSARNVRWRSSCRL